MLNTVPIMIGTTMTHRLITVLLILSALRAQTLLRPVRPLVPAPTLCVAAPTGLPALLGAAPALPRFCKLPEYPSSASTVTVNTAAEFQEALTGAKCGQLIHMQTGVTYAGNFTVPGLACPATAPVLVANSHIGALRQWTVPSRSLAGGAAVPTIIGKQNATAALNISDGAANWYFAGIEITEDPTAVGVYPIVSIGDNTSSIAALPHDITFDRCLVHPSSSTTNFVRGGIDLNVVGGAVIYSAIWGIVNNGQDTQAILAQNTPGPLLIAGNDLEATGENIMLATNCGANAGSTARDGMPMGSQGWQPGNGGIPTCPVPSDVTVRLNHFRKQLVWQSQSMDVKNLFEIKHGQRVLLDSNILDTSYSGGQAEAIIMNCFYQGIYVCQDFTVTNNLIEHVPAVGSISGNGEPTVSTTCGAPGQSACTIQTGQRVLFRNNLAVDVNGNGSQGSFGPGVGYGGTGESFQLQYTGNFVADHNTILNEPPSYLNGLSFVDQPPSTNVHFQYTNNLIYASPTAGGMTPGQTIAALPAPVLGGDVFVGDYWPNINTWGGIGSPPYPPGILTAASTAAPVAGQPACNIANKPIAQCWPLDWALVGFIDFTGGNAGRDLPGMALAATSPYHNAATDGTDIGANVPAVLAAIKGVQ
jgi:hypothetical protein